MEAAEKAEKRNHRLRGERLSEVDIDRNIALRVRMRRIMLGLTREQLAELTALSRSQVYKIETGRNNIAADRLYWLAQALGVDIGYFYEGLPEARSRGQTGSGMPTGALKFVERLIKIWKIEEHELVKMLGLEHKDDHKMMSTGGNFYSRDVKDRVRHLIRIREALDSLFKNAEVERGWLRESRSELQGESPLALLLEGSMENLLTVSQFVQWMAGR